jgi:4-hydroxy-4-methyl-2-oxoglutarate aldolase
MSSDETIEKLRKLDTACLCDAEKALSLGLRVMSSDLRPIRDGLKLVGLAHTVRCHDDFLTVIKALRDAQAGEVIVIDSQNSTRALTGELFPTEAMRKGLAGIVNDGPCRDTVIVREMEIPYYARSVCCIPGRTDKLFETQIPIICGGVTVNPGDLIVGDDDGLIVGTENEFLQLITIAEEVQRKEDVLLDRMSKGTSLLDMINFDEHCANIEQGKESQLEFLV